MNHFGRIFRVSIFGESHGPAVGIVIDGCPPGIPLKAEDFLPDLERRKGGTKGTTPRKEDDLPEFLSGVYNGFSTGAPMTILFPNRNVRSADYDKLKDIPRPGHADLVAAIKSGGYNDPRGGGHFSGRLTVSLVAAGVVAKQILKSGFNSAAKSKQEIKINATILSIGGESDTGKGLQKAIDAKDSVGGIIECIVTGLPSGVGEPFFDSVESVISHLVFSIPAVKAIEFGAGFRAAAMFGTEHNDVYTDAQGNMASNHAGGVLGGLTNGNPLVFRIAVKPTSSTPKEQDTFNPGSGQMESISVKGRHDLCIALRVPVVLEAVTAIAITDLLLLDRAAGQPSFR